ncbi:hypothetical protein D3C85_488990 [compost metagenome]
MKAMIAGRLGKTLFVYTLLLVAGCSHHSDIGLDRNHANGVTAKGTQAYIACIKHELTSGTKTFTVEDNGSINLLIGSIDRTTAVGLVQLSRVSGQTTYTVYQRHAWVDKGRLINAAQGCAKD